MNRGIAVLGDREKPGRDRFASMSNECVGETYSGQAPNETK